jgi:GNAT superfamily N-acetyltransferase
MTFRDAWTSDITQMQSVRSSVKENVLSNPALVTSGDYEEYITVRGKGWVCEINDSIAGFSIADLKENNIWALFVRPEFEGRGIGRKLHDIMLDWYFSKTKEYVWLSTERKSRAEIFYKKAGWKEAGQYGKEEIKFEMTSKDWEYIQIKRQAMNKLFKNPF